MPVCLLHNYEGLAPCFKCEMNAPVLLWNVRSQRREESLSPAPSILRLVAEAMTMTDLGSVSVKPPSPSASPPKLSVVRNGLQYTLKQDLQRRARQADFDERTKALARLQPIAIDAMVSAAKEVTWEPLVPALVECFELSKHSEKGIGYFAQAVFKNLKGTDWWSSPLAPDLDLFLEVVWKALAANYEEERGVPNADLALALGMSRGHDDRGGIRLHFVSRTGECDWDDCVQALECLVKTISGFIEHPDALLRTLLGHINLITADALVRYSKSVFQPLLCMRAESIGDNVRKALSREQAEAWVKALRLRWATVIASHAQPLVHVLIDRAGLSKAFGGVAYDSRATPKAFMSNDPVSLQRMPLSNLCLPFIKVNLDATGTASLLATLAHEIAHALGSNPSDCSSSGHLDSPEDYVDFEFGFGPKILFDAYFFEALIEFSNGVYTERMRKHGLSHTD